MHFKFRHTQKIVGGFFLLTCMIIVVLLVLVARGQKWFQPRTGYYCFFDRGMGLKVGTDVMIQGLMAGSIKHLTLGGDNRIRVDFDVERQYAERVREGSLVKLVQPLIGASRIQIQLGPKENPYIPAGGEIPAADVSASGLDQLIERANHIIAALEEPQGDLMQSLANIRQASGDLATGLANKESSLRLLMERRELYDDLTSAAARLDHLLGVVDDQSPEIQDAIVEARRGLEEVNKVILALQKSIFLRGHMKQYLKEDSTLRSTGRIGM